MVLFLNNIRDKSITDLRLGSGLTSDEIDQIKSNQLKQNKVAFSIYLLSCIVQSARATSLLLRNDYQRCELLCWLGFRHRENNLNENKTCHEENTVYSVCMSNTAAILCNRSYFAVYYELYNNQIYVRALIDQSAMVYCAGKRIDISRVF